MNQNVKLFFQENAFEVILFRPQFNSLWLSDTIWWHRSGSTFAQVMACCLAAPSHYLNQCCHVSSVRFRDIWLRGISQEITQPSVTKVSLKIDYPKFHLNLPGANKLSFIHLLIYISILSTSVIHLCIFKTIQIFLVIYVLIFLLFKHQYSEDISSFRNCVKQIAIDLGLVDFNL